LYFHLYCKPRCFWRNLHYWQKFYTAAGSDSMDKSQICKTQLEFDQKLNYVEMNCWVYQSCYIDLLNLTHVFVKVVTCISRPLRNKPHLEFDQELNYVKKNCLICQRSYMYFSPFAKQKES